MSVYPIPEQTRLKQRRGSDPGTSAWVSANAGSGKTHVLAQRVVRLLLTGVAPSKILCLTFTKAAAANMSARVFDVLAEWTNLADNDLSRAIAETGAQLPNAEQLVFARCLFARAVETPGGLKIQTIHAFCEKLLHQFPFEANVAAKFDVIDDAQQGAFIDMARRGAVEAAVEAGDQEFLTSLQVLAAQTTERGVDDLIAQAVPVRTKLQRSIDHHGGLSGFARALSRQLGLTDHIRPETIVQELLSESLLTSDKTAALRDRLERGKSKDRAVVEQLQTAGNAAASGAIERYVSIFLTDAGEPRRRILTTSLRAIDPELGEIFDVERTRVARLFAQWKAARTVERTIALLTFLQRVFTIYSRLKQQRGYLDFDDLIERTLALVTHSNAAWVLYKLDAGIDHVLVDEAQDTSEEQWEILRLLTDEFLGGADRAQRTFFAVGDEKQSIFSFQGAAPHKFEDMRRYFAEKLNAARLPFASIELTLSFRSVHDVLSAVDKIFADPDNYSGLSGNSEKLRTAHESRKLGLPGLIEVWEPVGSEARDTPRDWRLPLDTLDAQDPAVVVAQRVAKVIAQLIAPGATDCAFDNDGEPRAIAPGDIMVLVRTRGAFFEAVIRALKAQQVPVAGADRLQLTEHIAVMDLIAAGRTSLLSEDDFSLACVLKSPLIDFDDNDLLALVPESGSLIASLVKQARDNQRYANAVARLDRWRNWARHLTPFEFYARLLGEDNGRRQFLARLGGEAGDAIDEFLKLALDHEQRGPPSLIEFLRQLEQTSVLIKRDMESGRDVVRVMTIHAAKGLEAKIVFLPDTCSMPNGRNDPKIFTMAPIGGHSLMAWSARLDDDPAAVATARQHGRIAAQDEYRRLLYVALTRAEERLYIAGFHAKNAVSRGCWYNLVRAALLDELQEVAAPWPSGKIWRRQIVAPRSRGRSSDPSALPAPPTLPSWLAQPAPAEAPPDRLLQPSARLRNVISMPLVERGRLMHTLLQYLPGMAVERRQAAGAEFLAARGKKMTDAERETLLQTAIAVIENAALAALFSLNSRPEVAVAGQITASDGHIIHVVGQIDRLAVLDEEVWIADFKTGSTRVLGTIPHTYLLQLALYRALIAPLHPGKAIRCFLIWTDHPSSHEIDGVCLDAALREVTHA
jgi:ATP-dependent helicase/nuclease subunit A